MGSIWWGIDGVEPGWAMVQGQRAQPIEFFFAFLLDFGEGRSYTNSGGGKWSS
jgi:hypothetical protein